MRIRPFDFKAAVSLQDALIQLDQSGPDAKVLAGGTDLVLNMKKKEDSSFHSHQPPFY